MVAGLLIAGAAVAAGVAGAAAVGLSVAAAQRIGSAYGRTVEQMREQQRLSGYYNQPTYYQHSSGSYYPDYRSHGYHSSHSYGYRY